MSDGDNIPIAVIHKIQPRISAAIEARDWDTCTLLANEICEQIKLAMNPATAHTGKVHLDGVYSVGTMRYDRAPKKAKRALNKMNRIMKTAKGTIR